MRIHMGVASTELPHFPLPIWNEVYSLFCLPYIRGQADLLYLTSLIFSQIADLLTSILKGLCLNDFLVLLFCSSLH